MKVFTKYQKQRKSKVMAILLEMAKRIRLGHLVVSDFGFWSSKLDNSVYFKIKLLSRDSEKEIKKFEELS